MKFADCEDTFGFLVRDLNVEDPLQIADDLNTIQIVIQPERIWHCAPQTDKTPASRILTRDPAH